MTLYHSKSIAGETVLITGASAGIGRSCALLFAEKGCSLILVARRLDKLQDVKREIVCLFPECSVKLEVCDISNISDVSDLVLRVKDMKIEVLVNNAGLAIGTHAGDQGPIENTLAMFNTNCIGMIALIRGISPGMRQRDSGDIVNIGSVAGTDHYAGGAIYCATKAAVEAFSDCLRMDLVDTNIRITEINPGLVSGTEFSLVRFNGDKEKAQIPYQGIACLTPMDIADQVIYAVTRPKNVQVAQIKSYCNQQAHAKYVIHRT